jgi:hypothetical protein
VVLAFSTLAPAANAAVLTGFLESETGPPNDVTWTIGVINAGPAAAMNAKISSATLTQTAGTACTPVLTLPGSLGTIAAGATDFASLTIDFTGCPTPDYVSFVPPPPLGAPLFTLDAGLSADGLTGSLHLAGLAPLEDRTVYPAAVNSVPEPSTWALSLLGFGLVGAAYRRRLLALTLLRPVES